MDERADPEQVDRRLLESATDSGDDTEAKRLYRKALWYADPDPEVSLFIARKAAEAVLADVARKNNVQVRSTLEPAMQLLLEHDLLSKKVLLALRTIQSYGNYGSHIQPEGQDELDAADIRPCLNALTLLLTWHGLLRDTAESRESRRALTDIADVRDTSRIADSSLIVVRAILQTWGLERILLHRGYSPAYVQLPWSDLLVEDVAGGALDVAIYNERRIRVICLQNSRIAESIQVLGRFGHSMGGRNFYILGTRNGRWGRTNSSEFLSMPHGAQIAVPRSSDMFTNLLVAFDTDEMGLQTLDIEIVDVPHHLGLELFNLNEDILAVGGQNLRMHARVNRRYFELLNSDLLDLDRQSILRQNAANVVVVNRNWLRTLGIQPAELYNQLLRNFLWAWSDERIYQTRVQDLVLGASFPPDSTIDERERLVKHVLYETYRFGAPS